MRKLTHLERRVLRYHGQPANTVAVAERLELEVVLEVRMQLRARGHVPALPGVEQEPTQLAFDDVDHLMRSNRAPQEGTRREA